MTNFDVSIKNLSFYYHEQCLFENLNLQLPAGTCTCLLGASGVGKSSLLHAMIGAKFNGNSHFSGEIYCDEQQALGTQIMLMTQQDGLLPWLSAIENVLVGYKLRGNCTESIRQKAIALLQRVGLNQQDMEKKPKELSGGMRQRVALVRTVVEDKPIWLLDEPFSAVDAITRYHLQNLLVELAVDKTVLMVTHDPLEALRLADFIYVLQGKPAKLRQIELPKTKTPRELTSELLAVQNEILALLN